MASSTSREARLTRRGPPRDCSLTSEEEVVNAGLSKETFTAGEKARGRAKSPSTENNPVGFS